VPFIRTSSDLNEKNGFCIDVAFWSGETIYDLVQLRPCKSIDRNKTGSVDQQVLFEGFGNISIENGDKCLEEVSSQDGRMLVFRPCWSYLLAQNFSLVPEGCLIKNRLTGHCLAASSTTSDSGVWRSRGLEAVDCNSVDKDLLS